MTGFLKEPHLALQDRSLRVICLVFLANLWQPLCHASSTQIIPVEVTMTYSSGSSARQWSVPIRSTDGQRFYTLSNSIEHWGGGEVEGIELVLKHPHDGPNAFNLLAPAKNWHGMQAFIFAANDFVNGPAKSIYGSRRVISIPRLGLVVRITVVDAKVGTAADGQYHQLDKLQLKVEIENTPTSN